MIKRSLIILPFLMLVLVVHAYADVTCSCLGNNITVEGSKAVIDPDFQGAIIITMPDGDILLLEAGDEVPAVPSGAMIEVFDGMMTIQGENGFTLRCGNEVGELIAELGSVKVMDHLNQLITLQAGETLKLSLTGLPVQVAPPTAATNPVGSPVDDLREPDSRNMTQSPSQ